MQEPTNTRQDQNLVFSLIVNKCLPRMLLERESIEPFLTVKGGPDIQSTVISK